MACKAIRLIALPNTNYRRCHAATDPIARRSPSHSTPISRRYRCIAGPRLRISAICRSTLILSAYALAKSLTSAHRRTGALFRQDDERKRALVPRTKARVPACGSVGCRGSSRGGTA